MENYEINAVNEALGPREKDGWGGLMGRRLGLPDNVAQTNEPPYARARHALLAAWNRKLAPQPDHLLLPPRLTSLP